MELGAFELVVLILAGLAGGFINVMAGGGSVITVPVMILLGVPGPVANGTNRLPILVQNISASLTYLRHGVPHAGLMVSLSLCAIHAGYLPCAICDDDGDANWYGNICHSHITV